MKLFSKQHILIAAHRGAAGGNIPCNTIPAYEIALMQGADIIETDVEMTGDGKLVVFHPTMEKAHLDFDGEICNMPWEEVKKLRYVNNDRVPTQFGIETFDDLLECFKDRCILNIDKFWGHPAEIYRVIKAHNMVDQVIVKSAPTPSVYDVLEEIAPDVPFMPIIRNPLGEESLNKKINYVGAEVLFKTEESPVISQEFIDEMHSNNKLLWVNSIIYNYRQQLAAGHSDDTALTESKEIGWGWLYDKGFDIIQTDWTQMLVTYLKDNNKYYRDI